MLAWVINRDLTIVPVQLNLLFLGPDQPIKFVNEMALFILQITCSIM